MTTPSIPEFRRQFESMCHLSELQADCMMDGNMFAEIAIVGEAPGEHEVNRKIPLIGASGQLFWSKMSKQHGLNRSQCYATNVIKRKLASVSGKQQIGVHELDLWSSLLRWELMQLPHLKYIIVLGDHALRALTGESGITKWRGSVLKRKIRARVRQEEISKEVTLLVTVNPAYCIREPKMETPFSFDLGKLKRIMNGTMTFPKPNVYMEPSYAEIDEYLTEAEQTKAMVGADIESVGGNSMSCFGVSMRKDEAMCIPIIKPKVNAEGKMIPGTVDCYDHATELKIRKRIQSFLIHPGPRLVTQNGMYDATFTWFCERIKWKSIYCDTMTMHHTLYPQLPHDLGFITTQYTDYPYYKDERDEWKHVGDITRYWVYNGTDCITTRQSAIRMLDELRAQGLYDFYFNYIMPEWMQLVLMTMRGNLIDVKLRASVNEKLTNMVGELYNTIQERAQKATGIPNYEVNPRSPKQLSKLFFSDLKLVGRGASTDKDNRDRMRRHPRTNDDAKMVIDAIDEYAKQNKLLSTYVESTLDDDNRVRCEYRQTGVASAPGRLSSKQTGWHTGMNLQNQPETMYPMFIAPDGYEFWYFDAEQAEARLVSYFANIPKWKEQFERARIDRSFDCHRALASDMFKIPYDDVPSADREDDGRGGIKVTQRFIAKRCRHGLNYRMGPDRLATTTKLPIYEATKVYNIYHITNPELRVWWDELTLEAKKNRALYNAFGRRLPIMQRIDEKALESIVAFKPQSTLGDHIRQVAVRCESDDNWPMYTVVSMNNHDALIGIAPIGTGKKCLEIARKHAEAPIMINGEPLIIPISMKLSKPDEEGVHRLSSLDKVEL